MNNLRNLRKKRGISLAELQRMTGYPLRTLENWDSDAKLIQSYHRIMRLSEILGCTMDEFMTKEEKCLYEGREAYITLFQDEDGVHINVHNSNDFTVVASIVVSREKALELLKYIKHHEDITEYIKKM